MNQSHPLQTYIEIVLTFLYYSISMMAGEAKNPFVFPFHNTIFLVFKIGN